MEYYLTWVLIHAFVNHVTKMGKREDGSCECQLITHWGADQWNGMEKIPVFKWPRTRHYP